MNSTFRRCEFPNFEDLDVTMDCTILQRSGRKQKGTKFIVICRTADGQKTQQVVTETFWSNILKDQWFH